METKLLDLNAYGVEEMSVAEMHETDGGFIFTKAALIKGAVWLCKWAFRVGVAYVLSDMACNPKATADAWAAGRERAMQ